MSSNLDSHRDSRDLLRETKVEPVKNNSYTYGDYLSWDDEQRYELIAGTAYALTPGPNRLHQQVLGQMYRQFADYLEDKKCKVYFAPFDVRLPEADEDDSEIINVVQPDLSVICDLDKLDDRGCKGAPDLIVEIVSPSSGGRDKKIKRGLYESHGVKEYWIVDYQDNTVQVYLLNDNGQFGKSEIYTEEEILPVSIFVDLDIDLKKVFSD